MQSETGCKINVSQASGADIEREIGLVGTRQAIEDAKRAIWEKVDQVVSTFRSLTQRVLTPRSVRRTTVVDVRMAMAAAVPTEAMITTHNSHSLPLMLTVAPPRRSLLRLQLTQPVVQLLIPMPSMVVTRTISPCGMLRLPSNSNKAAHHPPDHRLSRARFDDALLLRPRRLMLACMTDPGPLLRVA
jgi:hypothetical protein